MTTLAIIGAGILGRSLIYTLAKEQKSFEKITLFHSDTFASPCSLHSTAIVAPRGLTQGHSPLGDQLFESYKIFSDHVALDLPKGVEKIIQYTAATEKLDNFKQRYPNGHLSQRFFKADVYTAIENGFLIDPKTYLDWLLDEALMMKKEHIEIIKDFVVDVEENERVHIKTQDGRNFSFDKAIFTAGVYNRFWKNIAPESKLTTSKSVQGSYFEFNQVELNEESFSLTFNGDNLIWNRPLGRLLIGSTSLETNHALAPLNELKAIYARLESVLNFSLPNINRGVVKVGLREKAQKREPYIIQSGHQYFMGGLYKNGFSLSLKMARSFSHQYL